MVKLKAKPPIEIGMMVEENNLKASNGVSPVRSSKLSWYYGKTKGEAAHRDWYDGRRE